MCSTGLTQRAHVCLWFRLASNTHSLRIRHRNPSQKPFSSGGYFGGEYLAVSSLFQIQAVWDVIYVLHLRSWTYRTTNLKLPLTPLQHEKEGERERERNRETERERERERDRLSITQPLHTNRANHGDSYAAYLTFINEIIGLESKTYFFMIGTKMAPNTSHHSLFAGDFIVVLATRAKHYPPIWQLLIADPGDGERSSWFHGCPRWEQQVHGGGGQLLFNFSLLSCDLKTNYPKAKKLLPNWDDGKCRDKLIDYPV